MNLFQRATRSCFRKPVKSLLLLLVVCIISLLFLSGMASRSANIATKDSTRQAIGAGFLLEYNPESRSQRVDEACQKISELYPDGQGSYGGVHQIKYTVMGAENWGVLTDNSFESLKQDDIEKIAGVEGIADYNITTVPTAVKHKNFERIEDADTDQTNDFQGVTLIGNRDMMLDANVLSGNVSVTQGRMTTKDDLNACVISEELANRICSRLNYFFNYKQFCDLLKTRELTQTRINRALLHIMLGIKKTDVEEYIDGGYHFYARLLGFRKDREKLLTRISKESSLPLLIRLSETETIPPLGRKMLRNDMLASNLYTSVVTDKFKTAFQNEYKQKVIKI